MRSLPLVIIPIVVLLHSSSGRTEPLSDAEVSRRLEFIETRLAKGTSSANLWWNSWYFGWMALTVGQAVFALATSDEGTRKDMAVGAASSTLGLIPLGLLRFPARSAARDLSQVPAGSSAQKRRKLIFAEHLLEAAAKDEKLRRSWVNHATSIGVSIAAGAVLAVVYDRPRSGILNAIGGIVLSELQIWTTPKAAIADWTEYQRLRQSPDTMVSPGTSRTGHTGVSVSISPQFGGLSISGHF